LNEFIYENIFRTNSVQRLKSVIKYTVAGVLFGLIFPVAATLIEVAQRQLNLSWSSIALVQTTSPLVWIVDSAPLFLGIFANQTGKREDKLQEQTKLLEQQVEERSTEIMHQKLFFEALVNNNPIAIVTMDRNQRIISINPAFQKIFGYCQEEIKGMEIDPLVSNPDRPDEALAITREVMEGKGVYAVGKRRRKDGSMVDVEIFGEPIMVNGNQLGVLGLYRDITVEKQTRDALSDSEERFRRMFSDSPIALRLEDFSAVKAWINRISHEHGENLHDYLLRNPDEFTMALSSARVVDLNDATLMLFKARDVKELQSRLHTILSQEYFKEALEIIIAMHSGATTLERELAYQRLDGKKIFTITKLSILPGYEESWERVLFSNLDITERKLTEERLTYISLHDMMTGVYNRAFFEEEMKRLQKSRSFPVSIVVADMDNLKSLNDSQGHQAGDAALQVMADIFRDYFRGDDVVARIGGDELAVLLPNTDEQAALQAIGRLQAAIERHNDETTIGSGLSVSLGCTTCNQDQALDDGFRLADLNMYQHKQQKRKQVNIGNQDLPQPPPGHGG